MKRRTHEDIARGLWVIQYSRKLDEIEILLALREAADAARQREARKSLGDQWDEAVQSGFDAGRREEAAEWEREIRDRLVRYSDWHPQRHVLVEILRRRGVKP